MENKITDLFVPYELAVKLKEKGFSDECFAKYLTTEIPENMFRFNSQGHPMNYNSGEFGRFVSAPLYQQVIDWFRETHRINIHADSLGLISYYGFVGRIGNYSNAKKITEEEKMLTYYEAMTKSIQEALKLINPLTP